MRQKLKDKPTDTLIMTNTWSDKSTNANSKIEPIHSAMNIG